MTYGGSVCHIRAFSVSVHNSVYKKCECGCPYVYTAIFPFLLNIRKTIIPHTVRIYPSKYGVSRSRVYAENGEKSRYMGVFMVRMSEIGHMGGVNTGCIRSAPW